MKRIACALFVAALLTGAAHANPSDTCDSGVVPPKATPFGAGVRIVTEPGVAKITACNDGSMVPPPAKGSAKLTTDMNKGFATIVFDGDSNNKTLGCSDGYAGARADGSGIHFYESSDGTYTTTSKEKPPATILNDVIANC